MRKAHKTVQDKIMAESNDGRTRSIVQPNLSTIDRDRITTPRAARVSAKLDRVV